MTTLGEKILALHERLAAGAIPHAVGGAIALAYAVDQARATHDVDLNIFLSVDHVDEVLSALPPGVRVRPEDAEVLRRDGQVRLRWDDNPVDVFLSTVPIHDVAAGRIRFVPFERGSIPIVSATDLTVFKALYGRAKDWVDIEAMRDAGTVDGPEALRWVADMLGTDSAQYRRLFEIITAPPRHPSERDDLPPALRPGARPAGGPEEGPAATDRSP